MIQNMNKNYEFINYSKITLVHICKKIDVVNKAYRILFTKK